MTTPSIRIFDTDLVLHTLRVLYNPLQRALICADLHIGKGAHFRSQGVPIPLLANKNNFWNLSEVLKLYEPVQLIVLGDLFHSTENIEWHDFTDFLDNYPSVKRVLVRGNHEMYFDETYHKMNFEVHDVIQLDKFILTHEPLEDVPDGYYNLCGHLHPAARVVGSARQTLRVPCFWFSKNQGVLPACGEFTGMHTVKAKAGDRLFLIAGNELIEKRI